MNTLIPRPRFGRSMRSGLAVSAMTALAFLMGVVAPTARSDALVDRVVSDVARLRHAVAAYDADNGELPAAAFDLSAGYDGGLVDSHDAPFRHKSTWRGPYLEQPLHRLAGNCFWGLAAPRAWLDIDRDGEADEAWARLHRGHGAIGEELALAVDRALDDGNPQTGTVLVTPVWIWVHLLES